MNTGNKVKALLPVRFFISVSAFNAYFIEDIENIFDFNFFFILTRFIHDNCALIHHYKTAAVIYRVPEIMGYHNRGHGVLFNHLVGKLHYPLGGFGV